MMRIPKKEGFHKRKLPEDSSGNLIENPSFIKHPKFEIKTTSPFTTSTKTSTNTNATLLQHKTVTMQEPYQNIKKSNSTREPVNKFGHSFFRVLRPLNLTLRDIVRNLNCLRPHQRNLALQIAALPISHGMCLFHGIGSGKTKCAVGIVYTLRTVYNTILNTPVLWITAKALIDFSNSEMTSLHASLNSLNTSNLYHFINIEHFTNHVDDYTLRYQNSKCIVVIDECHNLRNCLAKRYHQVFRFVKSCAVRTFCMTATPFVNHPQDMAGPTNLVLAATGRPSYDYLPKKKTEWDEQFSTGAHDPLLIRFIAMWSIYEESEENKREHFPRVERSCETVPMSTDQEQVYKKLMMSRKPKQQYQLKRKSTGASEEEKAATREFTADQIRTFSHRINSGRVHLNDANDLEFLAYIMRMRQLCNRMPVASDEATHESTSDSEPAPDYTPKIDYIINRAVTIYHTREECRMVIYSNFIDNGIEVYKQKLRTMNIPFVVLTGKENNAAHVLESFNSQDKCVLLLSSAGCQGLNLKRGTVLFVTDVHFNECRMIQIEGRVIRFDGHAGMKDPTVEIVYVSLVPHSDNKEWRTADQYMMDYMQTKQTMLDKFIREFIQVRNEMALREVSRWHNSLFFPRPNVN